MKEPNVCWKENPLVEMKQVFDGELHFVFVVPWAVEFYKSLGWRCTGTISTKCDCRACEAERSEL